jgi:hypothetical protein
MNAGLVNEMTAAYPETDFYDDISHKLHQLENLADNFKNHFDKSLAAV